MTKSSLIWKNFSQKTAVRSCRLWRLNLNFHDIPPSSVGVRFCSPMLISDLDFGILPRLLLSIRSFRAKADFLVVSILEIGAECPNHPWMDSSPLYRKSSLLLNLESEVKLFAWKQGGSPDRPWVLHFFFYMQSSLFYICNRHCCYTWDHKSNLSPLLLLVAVFPLLMKYLDLYRALIALLLGGNLS